ncbi:hypothetical protein [Streptomyces sp. NPDC086023]|uniref:hypothetical protein n=1 Tax=Streptomyces sp. NPDC086023 TaxID=3365746 RepID=UPI0037D22023
MMNKTARGSLAALMTCMATAAAVSPALAAEHVPVDVPLEALEVPLGMQTPHLATGLPVPVPGIPEGPVHHTGEMLPNPVLPAVPLTGELAPTLASTPVPDLLGTGKNGEAKLAAPASDLVAKTPGAVVGAPMLLPDGDHFGLPALTKPQLGILAPVLQGDPGALLGLS